MALINSPENGATEIPGSSNKSLVVFLAGPIRYWWGTDEDGTDRRDTHEFWLYQDFRNTVRDRLSEDFLVYAPHLALRGPWDEEVGQAINNSALRHSHAYVRIDYADVPAEGTDAEEALARRIGKPVYTVHSYGSLERVHVQLKGIKR